MDGRVRSFRPIAGPDARVLILGSMPGRASLVAGQYYAHPRNAFWPILARLLGFDAATPYARRVRALKSARIALWDVLESCVRIGSLDTAIEHDTLSVNDFGGFFRGHRRIERVYFNGAMAEKYFRRHVLSRIEPGRLGLARLPSTSPANASIPFARKLRAWRAVVPSRG